MWLYEKLSKFPRIHILTEKKKERYRHGMNMNMVKYEFLKN